ncbi:MAG: class I SAM-dependent methyltransferase [Roseateles sp.]|uniref:class I SAM-dependent methyltransferase n=1 Tax=Roseateles sp. TaxID=1971397 RepID=UPI004035CFDA
MRVSFRDPDGNVEDDGQQVWRRVQAHAAATTAELLDSPLYADLVRDGLLIGVEEQHPQADGSLLLRHRRVEMPTYAFEWTPAMLADAARLTLEIQRRAWAAGWNLKDAATSNVLFEGCKPVFCDLLSLQRRQPADPPGWLAYGQFVRHFVLPLLAVAELGRTPRDIFLAHRDGLRAVEIAPFIPWHAHLGLAMWLHVRLPARLERRRIRSDQKAAGASKAGGADGTPWLLGNLGRFIDRLESHGRSLSTWSEYTGNRDHYQAVELTAKRKAVEALLSEGRCGRVLDIGANSGEFSLIAARAGSQVLALDDDVNALHDLHIQARRLNVPVQCLHANFAQPTPATGWRLAETLGLPQRFAGRFDLVLALAVIHHLTVTERLPTTQLFEVLADCCRDTLLLEFVPRDDPRFIELAGPNMDLYQHWDVAFVLSCAEPWFELHDQQQISEHRKLLRLRRRSAHAP